MRKVLPWLIVVVLVAVLFAFRGPVAEWGEAAWAQLAGQEADPQGPRVLVASGSIEARDLSVAARAGGRIVSLEIAEGQLVAAGDVVARIDSSILEARIAEAEAAVRLAEANVAMLRAGARDADVKVARAAVTQAEAVAASSRAAAADAEALVNAPGMLDVEIARAAAAFEVAREQTSAAEASIRAADLEHELWGRIVRRLEQGADVPLPPELGGETRHVDAPAEQLAEARLQWNLKSQAAWAAHARHAAVAAEREAARQALSDLRARKADPVQLRGQAASAAAAVAVAEAAIEAARATTAVVEAGVAAEQIASAEAAVAEAGAGRAALEATLSQYEVRAPAAGVITDLVLVEGEVAAPGATVARLADLSEMTVTVYVPQPRLSEVRAGQPAAIRVDAYPGRSFPGTVRSVADEAQFTPKNVLSQTERADTVYAVTIAAPNPDGALKAGMPVDAAFCETGSACEYPFEAAASAGADAGSGASGTRYSGAIEANTVAIAAEVSGRAVEAAAAEGETVTAGSVLVVLEGAELAAQRAQAEAAVGTAQAELARVQAAAQPERVAQARAVVGQAEAAVAAARARLDAAREQRERPQELDSQISAARQQVRTANTAVDAARAAVKTAQVLQESLANPGSDEDKTRRAVYDAQAAAAAAGLRAAQAQVRGAQGVLAQLLAIRENPVGLDAAVHAAEGAVKTTKAEAEAARARLAQVQAPAQAAQIALAEAKVRQARAALATAGAAQAKLEVRTPIGGQVVTQGVHAGEVVNAGAALYTIAELGTVRLKVYVPVSELATVRLGAAAQVAADAYPGRTFSGTITRVSERTEYTPQNVQTEDERARMVVAVEVTLENPDGALRPGMVAEATW